MRNLISMGYDYNMIKRLLCIKKIENIEDAIVLLTKDELGLH